MKLDFENDADLIVALSERAARKYVRTCHNPNEYDNALCDAYVLATEIEFDYRRDDAQRDAFIVRRIVGKLIDEFRKHNSKRVQGFNLESLENKTEPEREQFFKDGSEFIKRFERIASFSVSGKKSRTKLNYFEKNVARDYLLLKLNALKSGDASFSPSALVAKKYEITKSRVSQILKRFRRCAKLYADLEGLATVVIVSRFDCDDDKIRRENPLFFYAR